MKVMVVPLACLALLLGVTASVHASFVIEPDIDGLDDGVITPSPNFSLGGDTTGVRQSARVIGGPVPITPTKPNLVGTTGGVLPNGDLTGSDSIFGATNVALLPHTYLYTYTPGIDGDNRPIAAGTKLNDDGDRVSGQAAGSSGRYRVYATWPQSQNVSGGDIFPIGPLSGLTLYALNDGSSDIAISNEIQNEDENPVNWPNSTAAAVAAGSKGVDGNLKGNEWEFLFEVSLSAGTTYVLRQQPTVQNSFASMRSGGVLFDRIPEPTSALLALVGLACLAGTRRR